MMMTPIRMCCTSIGTLNRLTPFDNTSSTSTPRSVPITVPAEDGHAEDQSDGDGQGDEAPEAGVEERGPGVDAGERVHPLRPGVAREGEQLAAGEPDRQPAGDTEHAERGHERLEPQPR